MAIKPRFAFGACFMNIHNLKTGLTKIINPVKPCIMKFMLPDKYTVGKSKNPKKIPTLIIIHHQNGKKLLLQ